MADNKVNLIKETFRNLMKDVAEDIYSDINYFKSSETRISVDKVNTEISKSNDKGVKVRVWDGEKFVESATTGLDRVGIKKVLDDVLVQVKNNSLDISNPIKLDYDDEKLEKDFIAKCEVSYDSMNLENKTSKLKEFRDKILEIDSDIVNARSALIEEFEENIFANSKGKVLYQKIPVCILVVVGFVKCDDGETRTVYESLVGNGLEVFDKISDKFEEFKELIGKTKKAKKLEGGKYKVVLSPKLSGLLAHESFGHGMEADTMMKDRALANDWVGKKIGGDEINIIDYPAVSGKHGEFYFDHEGSLAKKVYLVKNGVINEPMADLYSKSKLGLKSSSNARFESFDHKHYTRMSNTFFEPGNKTVDELISQVDDGIYVMNSSGGMEDPKGWGVQLQGCFGQRIKNGKLVDEYYDGFAFTGFLPDIISNISGLSKEFEIEGGGSCGKGHKEWVRVSEGGPYMLIDEVILG